MDVVVWLRSLGLGKYEAALGENDIDETVLPSLTEEHLKQLGVTALGHRVKLLDARRNPKGRALQLLCFALGPDAIYPVIRGSFPARIRFQSQQKLVSFKQIFGIKTFCEFVEHRLQQLESRCVPALALP